MCVGRGVRSVHVLVGREEGSVCVHVGAYGVCVCRSGVCISVGIHLCDVYAQVRVYVNEWA